MPSGMVDDLRRQGQNKTESLKANEGIPKHLGMTSDVRHEKRWLKYRTVRIGPISSPLWLVSMLLFINFYE